MTKGTHLLRSALLALLALAVISGASFAGGDLFDSPDYDDCPTKTRLRDGQISDLMVARDSDEADEVNVSWSATDASSWGLGANAFDTSLVVILNDGSNHTKTMKLGQRKVTFDGIDTGKKVKVQMAIVVDHADGDYLISDILEMSINQSLTKPAFTTDVMRVTTAAVADNPDTTDDETVAEVTEKTGGTLYYVGYNENFGNYKTSTYNFSTMPTTARLRIGLAHSTEEDDDARDKVDFEAYTVRITGEDGDAVSEADDVDTMASSYTAAANRLVFGTLDAPVDPDVKFSNVRINDGGKIQASVQDDGPTPTGLTGATGTYSASSISPGDQGLSYVAPAAGTAVNDIFAMTPDEHRDFPVDTFSSDETYTITAWAINEDEEVISPVASLSVRPIDESLTLTAALDDYVTGTNADPATGSNAIFLTEFTVLK